MRHIDDIAALVLTFNEARNISRLMSCLKWVRKVYLVDSFSTDETLTIARSYSNVEVLQNHFSSFADQCNWGLSQINAEWILSLDADYVLTEELTSEIKGLGEADKFSGYAVSFKYCIGGIPLRSTLLPPRTVLYRKDAAVYQDEGHGHRVKINGRVGKLDGLILHDDRKPLSRWLESQDRYMRIEAPHLLTTPNDRLSIQDRLRKKIFFAPPIMFLYLLFGRGLMLDGWRGWYYVAQRTLAELLLSLRLLTQRHHLEAREE